MWIVVRMEVVLGRRLLGMTGRWSKLLLCGFVSPTPSFLPRPMRHSSFLCEN